MFWGLGALVGVAASVSLDDDREQWVLSPISSQNQIIPLK